MSVKAMYPGTFDPMTLGHKELASRAAKIFDSVVVAIAANPEKNPMFSLQERVSMLRSASAAGEWTYKLQESILNEAQCFWFPNHGVRSRT